MPAALFLTWWEPKSPSAVRMSAVEHEQSPDQPADVEPVGGLGGLDLVLASDPGRGVCGPRRMAAGTTDGLSYP